MLGPEFEVALALAPAFWEVDDEDDGDDDEPVLVEAESLRFAAFCIAENSSGETLNATEAMRLKSDIFYLGELELLVLLLASTLLDKSA